MVSTVVVRNAAPKGSLIVGFVFCSGSVVDSEADTKPGTSSSPPPRILFFSFCEDDAEEVPDFDNSLNSPMIPSSLE